MRVQATPHTQASELALHIYESTLGELHAEKLIRQSVQSIGDVVFVQGNPIVLSDYRRIFILGIGKASVEMADGLVDALGSHLSGGLVIAPHVPMLERAFEVVKGSHPIPDEQSIIAGEKLLEFARDLTEEDFVFFVLSGGASALAEAPVRGVSLTDLQLTNELLIGSGADIQTINAVRAAISRIKGGGLARVISPASGVVLVLSDVSGSDFNVVGSGPMIASNVLDPQVWRFPNLPPSVVNAAIHALPKPAAEFPHYVVGSVSLAIQHAATIAKKLGLEALPFADRLKGEARIMSRSICVEAVHVRSRRDAPFCMIFGGEATVRLGNNPGPGGRCQEMAVAAAMRLSRMPGCSFLAAGTDGRDGPTEFAGAFVDELTCERAVEAGLSVRDSLRSHSSGDFMFAVDGLIRTGPTGTNVNDLVLFVGT